MSMEYSEYDEHVSMVWQKHFLPGHRSAAELAVLDPVLEPATSGEAALDETDDQSDEEELELASSPARRLA